MERESKLKVVEERGNIAGAERTKKKKEEKRGKECECTDPEGRNCSNTDPDSAEHEEKLHLSDPSFHRNTSGARPQVSSNNSKIK